MGCFFIQVYLPAVPTGKCNTIILIYHPEYYNLLPLMGDTRNQ